MPLNLRHCAPLLALACQAGAPPAEPPAPEHPITVALHQQPRTLHPLFYETILDAEIGENLFQPLLQAEFKGELVYEPSLATGWSFDEAGTSLSMSLRPDGSWSDGQPVTAQDVAYTYEIVAAGVTSFGEFLAQMDPEQPVQVLDDTHLVFHFTQAYEPNDMLTHAGTLPLLARHAFSDATPEQVRERAFTDIPLGNGPWKVERWERPGGFVLVPSEHWVPLEGQGPQLQRVHFQLVPDSNARLMALDKGEVDLVYDLQLQQAARLSERGDLQLRQRGWRSWVALGWNQRDPDALAEGQQKPHALFAQAEARRALARAIDAQGLVEELLTLSGGQVFGRRAFGTISPSLQRYHHDHIAPFPLDPAAAKASLAQLGWQDSDGDGVLDRDGVPFRFTLLHLESKDHSRRVAERVAERLRAIGAEVVLTGRDGQPYLQALDSGDFDAILLHWSAKVYVDPRAFWHSEGAKNFVGFSDPQIDELIELGEAATTPAQARPHWLELQERIHHQQPYTFLHWQSEVIATSARLTRVESNLLSRFHRLDRWRADDTIP